MMKRLFSTKNSGSNSNTKGARPGRPSSPPPNIYSGYVDSNASALGSSFFGGNGALPQNSNGANGVNGVNGANGDHAPTGYLNGNGVTAGYGGGPGHNYSSSASSVTGSLNHSYTTTGRYLNSVPVSSVNGSDSGSIYGGSTLGHGSNASDAGFKNIPLPPAAPVTSPTGTANGQQYPPHGGPGMADYRTSYNGPAGPSPYPPRQPSVNYHQQPYQQPQPQPKPRQHQPMPNRGRRPVNPVSEGLEAVPEQRAHVSGLPPSQYAQNHAVHVKVTAADVRETTCMLRQLYKMELQIYSERYAVDRSRPEETRREEMRRKVDLLREEIEEIVGTWSVTDAAGWTSEELQHVQYSLKVVSNLRTMAMEAEK